MKRLISFILIIVLLSGSVASTAFAAEITETETAGKPESEIQEREPVILVDETIGQVTSADELAEQVAPTTEITEQAAAKGATEVQPETDVLGITNNNEYNVTDFGANGSDENPDSRAINQVLSMALNNSGPIKVFIPAGEYYLDIPLVIYSNTELILDQEATIIRVNDNSIMLYGSAKGEPQGGYEDLTNVTISGGVWNGNVTQRDAEGNGLEASNLIYMFHGRNIQIKDTTIKNCCGDHFIDFTAIADSSISNVTFQDFIPKSGVDYVNHMSPEAVHLDYAEENASGFAKPFDETPCKNVTVQNSTFNNCPSGVGNHHPETKTAGVKILNNTFNSIDNNAVVLVSFKDFIVSGNKVYKTNSFVQVTNGSTGIVDNNEAVLESTNRKAGNFVNIVDAGSSVDVTNNKFSDRINDKTSRLNNIIYVKDASANIQDNNIAGIGVNGIGIKDGHANIKKNVIKNVTKNGISVDGGTVTISDMNEIEDCGEQGIIANGKGKITISNNKIKSTQSWGINVQNYNADILSNTISDVHGEGKDGILYSGTKNGTANIQENDISNTKRDGIHIYDSVQGINDIVNNKVTDTGRNGIAVNASSALVEKNTVSNVMEHGISITGSTQGTNRILGNTVVQSGKHGIVASASNISIENNTSYGNKEPDIGVYNSSGQVANNGVGAKGVNIVGGTVSKHGNYIVGTWENVSGKWRYKYADGTVSKLDWKQIGNSWYYFDKDGWMMTSWKVIDGYWYYFAADGKMREGWQKVGDTWYYFGEAGDGKMREDWQKIGNAWYYFGGAGDGKMRTSWQKIGSTWYYFGGADDGKMREGWQKMGNTWYYFGGAGDGKMREGWQLISGEWYYFGGTGDGKMKEGWQLIGIYWYYFGGAGDGKMKTGWQTIDGKRYFFDSNGILR
ncbi:MAG: right-handed parallel beta-helix repeat-containing protein [Muricomes sp.]